MYIDWDDPFFVDLTDGTVSPEPTQEHVLAIPKYGTYGGAFNPDQELLTKPNGNPYSYTQLLNKADPSLFPVDITDYFYYVHDVKSSQAGEGYTPAQAEADIDLIRSLTLTDTSFDPEASLYDAVVTIGLIGQLAIHGELDQISPTLLLAALTDAANDLEFALQNLPEAELLLTLDALFETDDDLTFTFEFAVTTTSFQEELAEAVAINAAALAINEPADGLFVNTWSGFSGGTSNYELVFHLLPTDLDLLSA